MTDTLSVDAPYPLRESTIDAARQHIWRRASAEAWTDQALDAMLAMLGLDEAPVPEVEAPEPEPVVEPAPEPEPCDPWFTMPDVLDESGATRHHIDRWVESGRVSFTAVRHSTGRVVPRDGACGTGSARLWTLGDVARACRMQHLYERWHRTKAMGLSIDDCAAIAAMGHLADLDPELARRVDWSRVAVAANAASETRYDFVIWRGALSDLAVRAAAIAIELGGAPTLKGA